MFPIVDAHHHLWEPGEGRYPWMHAGVAKFMGATAPVCTRYDIESFCREVDSSGDLHLLASVHLQCGRRPEDPAEETAWVQQQASRAGLPMAIVGYADLADPELESLLNAHLKCAGFRGVRQMLNWHEYADRYRLCERGDFLADAAWRRGYARLGERGLTFDLQVNPWQLEAAANLARDHPQTTMVVNHAGLPFDNNEARRAWHCGMAALADQPQVFVKFSGLGMIDPHWTAASVRPLFNELLRLFGAHRIMFGSNFPIDRLYKQYAEIFSIYRTLTEGLDETQRMDLFHRTASRVYRLETTGP